MPARRDGADGGALIRTPAFVGRQAECAALAEALARPPAVVLVEGEAGIGKSRLLHEVLSSPEGRRCRGLIAVCPPFREPYTLGPVVDALRQTADSVRGLGLTGLAGALRPLFPEWAADLPPAPEPAEDATASRHRLFGALAELLERLEIGALVVEDVHWADDATLEFLLFLGSRRPQPLSLVVTYRQEDVPAGSLLRRLSSLLPVGATRLRLTLRPLDVTQIEELASSMLSGAPMSARFAAFLHEHTDGIPLAAEESVRLLYDRADLTRRDGSWVRRRLRDIAVPPSVRDAVLERAGRLSPDAQLVLHAAAVLTDPADDATLLAVTELPDDRGRAALAEVLGCGLLHEGDRGLLAFRHALACRAVLDTVPAPQRRVLHRRAGRILEAVAMPPVARLARHYREAGDTANWSRYAEQAAGLAMAAGDDATAATVLYDLITTAGLPARTVARLTGSLPFGALDGNDRFLTLVRVLREVLAASALEPGDEAALRFQVGHVLLVMAEYEAAQVEFERAVRHLDPHSEEAVHARIFLGLPLGRVRSASVHLRWLHEAERLMPAVPLANRMKPLVDRTTALLLLGEEDGWAQAERIPPDGADPVERRQVVTGHANVGHLAMMWGRYPEAERRLATGLELTAGHGYDGVREIIVGTQAHLDWFTGAWTGLADRVAALADDEEVQSPARSEAALVGGLLLAAADDRAAAARLTRAHEWTRRSNAVDGFVEAAAALARLRLSGGRVDDALRITDEPVDIAVHKGIWVCGTDVTQVRVAALIAAGRIEEAEALTATYAGHLDGHDAPGPQAGLAVCRALLAEGHGRHAEAADRYVRAALAWEALPRRYDALLARERQAGALLALGRTDDGLALLTGVFKDLAALGARGDAVRTMRTLRRYGVEVKRPWWGGRRGYGDRLSPREVDVARLLAGGRTNREIAEALFLSPKTVARHVETAMRKLGVTSRTALAVRAVEAGIASAEPRDE